MMNMSLSRSYAFLALIFFGSAISTTVQSYSVSQLKGLLSSKQLVIGGCATIAIAVLYGVSKYCTEVQKSASPDPQGHVNMYFGEGVIALQASQKSVLQSIVPYAHEFALSFARMAGLCVAAGCGYWYCRSFIRAEIQKIVDASSLTLKHDMQDVLDRSVFKLKNDPWLFKWPWR